MMKKAGIMLSDVTTELLFFILIIFISNSAFGADNRNYPFKSNDNLINQPSPELVEGLFKSTCDNVAFDYSDRYKGDHDIIMEYTNMSESENRSDGTMKDALIGIMHADLNGDGNKEIIAHIVQQEWCGGGGGNCSVFILMRGKDNKVVELLHTGLRGGMCIQSTNNSGYSDIRLFDMLVYGNNNNADGQSYIYRYINGKYKWFAEMKWHYDGKSNINHIEYFRVDESNEKKSGAPRAIKIHEVTVTMPQ